VCFLSVLHLTLQLWLTPRAVGFYFAGIFASNFVLNRCQQLSAFKYWFL